MVPVYEYLLIVIIISGVIYCECIITEKVIDEIF